MSYLNTPRLTFAGKFQADPSTVNNDVNHYDIDTFQPVYQQGQTQTEQNGWWNPNGTGNFRLLDCVVTSVTYKDGTIGTDDPIVGMSILDSNDRTPGKIVDLDPQQQTVSMIFGMVVRLWNGEKNLFKGDFKPVGFTNIWWSKCNPAINSSQGASGIYQSVLQHMDWCTDIAMSQSRYLRELFDVSPDKLSIKFNVDLHDNNPFVQNSPNQQFTIGRIVGSIGPSFANEPDHFIAAGRQLYPGLSLVPQIPGYMPNNGVFFATAILDEYKDNNVVVLDMGNSLQINGLPGKVNDVGKLQLACLFSQPGLSSVVLGEIDYLAPGWYEVNSGIVTIPITPEQAKVAKENPLSVIKVATQSAVALSEVVPFVRADNFVYRINPGESAIIDVYASSLGVPLSDTKVNLMQQNDMISIFGQTIFSSTPTPPATGTPDVFKPFNAGMTDEKGKATFTITVGDPGNSRKIIDGQLYALWCYIGDNPTIFSFTPPTTENPLGVFAPMSLSGVNPNDFISILVHDSFKCTEPVIWPFIQPIMQQYANLYPLMSKGIFNIANQSIFDSNAKILEMVFNLPIEDPNHMPATRDLSRDKLNAINKYISTIIG